MALFVSLLWLVHPHQEGVNSSSAHDLPRSLAPVWWRCSPIGILTTLSKFERLRADRSDCSAARQSLGFKDASPWIPKFGFYRCSWTRRFETWVLKASSFASTFPQTDAWDGLDPDQT